MNADELREQVKGFKSAIASITADMRDKDKTADRLKRHKEAAAYHAAQVAELEMRLSMGRDMIAELEAQVHQALDAIYATERDARKTEFDKLAAELLAITRALGGPEKVKTLLQENK